MVLVQSYRTTNNNPQGELFWFAGIGPVKICPDDNSQQQKPAHLRMKHTKAGSVISFDVSLRGRSNWINSKFGTSYGEDDIIYVHVSSWCAKEGEKNTVADRLNNLVSKQASYGETGLSMVLYGELELNIYTNKTTGKECYNGLNLKLWDFAPFFPPKNNSHAAGSFAQAQPNAFPQNGVAGFAGVQAPKAAPAPQAPAPQAPAPQAPVAPKAAPQNFVQYPQNTFSNAAPQAQAPQAAPNPVPQYAPAPAPVYQTAQAPQAPQAPKAPQAAPTYQTAQAPQAAPAPAPQYAQNAVNNAVAQPKRFQAAQNTAPAPNAPQYTNSFGFQGVESQNVASELAAMCGPASDYSDSDLPF
jgi:hypothetical protein